MVLFKDFLFASISFLPTEFLVIPNACTFWIEKNLWEFFEIYGIYLKVLNTDVSRKNNHSIE